MVGVSAVIGVILMVAIVISVISIIYYYTNIATESKVESLNILQFTKYKSAGSNILSVSFISEDIYWEDVSLRTDNPNMRFSFKGGPEFLVGDNWCSVNHSNFGSSGIIKVGDLFFIGGDDIDGKTVIMFRNDLNGQLLGKWTIII